MDWLCAADMAVHHQIVSQIKLPGTGDWLFKSDDFSNWLDTTGSVLWIHAQRKLAQMLRRLRL
jgi:hypothetical protein